jgi:hypothetical protein
VDKKIRANSCHSWTKKFVPICAIRGQKKFVQIRAIRGQKKFVLIRAIRGQKNSCQFVPFVDKKIRVNSCHSWTKKFVLIRAIRGQKIIREQKKSCKNFPCLLCFLISPGMSCPVAVVHAPAQHIPLSMPPKCWGGIPAACRLRGRGDDAFCRAAHPCGM